MTSGRRSPYSSSDSAPGGLAGWHWQCQRCLSLPSPPSRPLPPLPSCPHPRCQHCRFALSSSLLGPGIRRNGNEKGNREGKGKERVSAFAFLSCVFPLLPLPPSSSLHSFIHSFLFSSFLSFLFNGCTRHQHQHQHQVLARGGEGTSGSTLQTIFSPGCSSPTNLLAGDTGDTGSSSQ